MSGSELDAWGLGNLESSSPCHSLMSYLKSKSLNSRRGWCNAREKKCQKHEGTAALSTWVAAISLDNGYSAQILPGELRVSSASLRGGTLIYHLFIGSQPCFIGNQSLLFLLPFQSHHPGEIRGRDHSESRAFPSNISIRFLGVSGRWKKQQPGLGLAMSFRVGRAPSCPCPEHTAMDGDGSQMLSWLGDLGAPCTWAHPTFSL